jgi:hypothetical protein
MRGIDTFTNHHGQSVMMTDPDMPLERWSAEAVELRKAAVAFAMHCPCADDDDEGYELDKGLLLAAIKYANQLHETLARIGNRPAPGEYRRRMRKVSGK